MNIAVAATVMFIQSLYVRDQKKLKKASFPVLPSGRMLFSGWKRLKKRIDFILFAVFPRGNAVNLFKGTNKGIDIVKSAETAGFCYLNLRR